MTYLERIVDEKQDVDDNIRKLESFRKTAECAQLPPGEQLRIVRQLRAMDAYSGILAERIESFSEKQE